MNALKIAVVDDDASCREHMRALLERYAREQEVDFRIELFDSSEAFITYYTSTYFAVFLDIEMPDVDGIKLGRLLRERDRAVPILYTTAFQRFAREGYQVSAVDYFIKPVPYFRLSVTLDALRRRLPAAGMLSVRNREGSYTLCEQDICYIEARGHHITIHAISGELECWGSLNELTEKLSPGLFSRCNSCYIVNLSFVSAMNGSDLVVNGERLHMSRDGKKQFLADMNAYLAGGR